MSSVSKPSSSSSTSHCRLFSKMFRKRDPQATDIYRGAAGRNSNSTLVDPQHSTEKGGQRDFSAASGTPSSKYGRGEHVLAPLPSEPMKSKKVMGKQPGEPKDTSTSPSSLSPASAPSQGKLTQAQREQAVVDVMSTYSWGSPFPGGRWKI